MTTRERPEAIGLPRFGMQIKSKPNLLWAAQDCRAYAKTHSAGLPWLRFATFVLSSLKFE
jgi:hypothetical protein